MMTTKTKKVMLPLANVHGASSITRRKSATALHDGETELASECPLSPLTIGPESSPCHQESSNIQAKEYFQQYFGKSQSAMVGRIQKKNKRRKFVRKFLMGGGGVDTRLEAFMGLWENEGMMR